MVPILWCKALNEPQCLERRGKEVHVVDEANSLTGFANVPNQAYFTPKLYT